AAVAGALERRDDVVELPAGLALEGGAPSQPVADVPWRGPDGRFDAEVLEAIDEVAPLLLDACRAVHGGGPLAASGEDRRDGHDRERGHGEQGDEGPPEYPSQQAVPVLRRGDLVLRGGGLGLRRGRRLGVGPRLVGRGAAVLGERDRVVGHARRARARGRLEAHPADALEVQLGPRVGVAGAHDPVVAVDTLSGEEADDDAGRDVPGPRAQRHRRGELLAVADLVVEEADDRVASLGVGDLEVVRELARGAQVLLDRLGRPQVVAVLGGEAVRELLDLLGGAGVEGEVLLAPRGGVDGLAGPAPGEVLLLRLDRSERRRVGAGSPLYARRPVAADGPRDAVEVGRADVVRYRELGSGDAVRVDDERVLVPTDLL